MAKTNNEDRTTTDLSKIEPLSFKLFIRRALNTNCINIHTEKNISGIKDFKIIASIVF